MGYQKTGVVVARGTSRKPVEIQDSHKEMEWATRKQVWLLLGGPVENGFDNL